MKTKWIAFNEKRMDEALGYRKLDTGNLIFELKMVRSVAAYIADESDDNSFTHSYHPELYIEMQVEDKIKYPCMCWVGDEEKGQSTMVVIEDNGRCHPYVTEYTSWKYATPLTDDELREIIPAHLLK